MDPRSPFHVGDIVIYRPTVRGRGWILHTDLERLVPERSYRVVEVYEFGGVDCLVVEGFEGCVPMGLVWSEFAKGQ